MTDLQKVAEAYACSGVDIEKVPEFRGTWTYELLNVGVMAGAVCRNAEVNKLIEALNYAKGVYAEACVLGEDNISLSKFNNKIEAILARGEK